MALEAYAALGAADLPAIRARLRELRRAADPLASTRALDAFRHAVGSRRADDVVDVAPGVALVLAQERGRQTVGAAAGILLERVGERLSTTESLGCVTELAAWGGDGMRQEAQRIAVRMGPRLAPVVIAARSSDERAARRWAEWAGGRLGLGEPGRFLAGLDDELVPDVLLALASARVMTAVPVVISFIDAPRSSTRAAAREALTMYGQNSIWVARDTYRIRTGEPADPEWGWRHTLDALFSVIDNARDEVVEADLARATAALGSGDRGSAWESLERALRHAPEPSGTTAGAAMLRLAELDLEVDDLAAAQAHVQVAERLELSPEDAPRRLALAELIAAERRLEAGVLDSDAYGRASEADPTCERCMELHARFEEAGTTTGPTPWRLWLATAAFLALGLLLWPTRRSAAIEPESRAEPTADVSAPNEEADATLPG